MQLTIDHERQFSTYRYASARISMTVIAHSTTNLCTQKCISPSPPVENNTHTNIQHLQAVSSRYLREQVHCPFWMIFFRLLARFEIAMFLHSTVRWFWQTPEKVFYSVRATTSTRQPKRLSPWGSTLVQTSSAKSAPFEFTSSNRMGQIKTTQRW